MNDTIEHPKRRAAFTLEAARQSARAAVKAAWWGAAGLIARRVAAPEEARPEGFTPTAPAAPAADIRRAWMSAFRKDARDVAEGLYPARDDQPPGLAASVRRAADFLSDARQVEARRRRGDGAEVRTSAPESHAYPAYYRQNFHFQTGGWFTADSARRYDAQVEALFAGTAAAMRRRALSILARHWRGRDHRGLTILDLACGSGVFLPDLAATFPRARLTGLDLSPAYLAEAARDARGRAALVQANAEQLPFADGSLDAVTCIYLFHELPPKVRRRVAAEIGRVLKPGGVLAFADSVQPKDEPALDRLLEAFPAYFHEPYYRSYSKLDLDALFAPAGLRPRLSDAAFLTKAILFEKV